MPAAALLATAALYLAPALLTAAPTEAWEPPVGAARQALVAAHVRPEGPPGFYRASGGAYLVRTDVGSEFALDAACFLERFRSQLRRVFGDPPEERYPPLVLIYRDEARYRRVVPGAGSSRGLYRAEARTLYTYLDVAKGERDFSTFYAGILLHEGTHQLLGTLCGPLPVWFNEGVASYFQMWDVRRPIEANLDRLRTTHYHFADIRSAFGTERWVPLSRLLALDAAGWAPDDFGPRTYLHYAEGASFISFLLASKPGQKTFVRTFEALRDGHDIGNVLDPESIRRLDEAWRADLAERMRAP